MAFFGFVLVFLIVFFIIIAFCTFAAIVCFIISAVVKHKYKKKAALDPMTKKPVSPIVLRIIGGVLLFPLVGSIAFIGYSIIITNIENHNSLWYNVNAGNLERVEQLIDKGISPDCTKESNEPAKDGEKTILMLLCENQGFSDDFDNVLRDGLTDEEKKMILLLLEKGADIEYRYYNHTKHDFDNVYFPSDGCGRTPLLIAVEKADYELVKLLVERGADIKAKDDYGYNAAAIVADELNDENGADILEYLINNGADTKCTTNLGTSIPFLVYRNEKYGNEKINEMLCGGR